MPTDEFEMTIKFSFTGKSKGQILQTMREKTLHSLWLDWKAGREDIKFQFTRILTKNEKVKYSKKEELEEVSS